MTYNNPHHPPPGATHAIVYQNGEAHFLRKDGDHWTVMSWFYGEWVHCEPPSISAPGERLIPIGARLPEGF